MGLRRLQGIWRGPQLMGMASTPALPLRYESAGPWGLTFWGLTFWGLTLTLVSAWTHWALSAGTRCPSSTVPTSAMVVMREFHEPSAELAWAAKGRAMCNSLSALLRSWATSAADVPGREDSA